MKRRLLSREKVDWASVHRELDAFAVCRISHRAPVISVCFIA